MPNRDRTHIIEFGIGLILVLLQWVVPVMPDFVRVLIWIGICVLALHITWNVGWKHLHKTSRKIATSLLVLLVISYFAWSLWPVKFVVVKTFSISSFERSHVNGYWVGQGGVDDYILFPVNIVLGLRITNMQEHPVAVEGLRIESMNRQGEWVALVRIPTLEPSLIYQGRDLSKLKLIEIDLLERKLLNTSMTPHNPVSGWLFLVYPKEREDDVFSYRLKVTLTDSEGNHVVVEPKRSSDLEPQDSVQKIKILVKPSTRNLSHAEVRMLD